MPIQDPATARFAGDNLIMLFYGLPGVGKSTLALSAPDPFWLDVDRGRKRVKREHLKPFDDTQSYTEILNDLRKIDPAKHKTIIIDTVGALIEVMKMWAGETDPGNALKKGGGFALAGYGIIKSEFIRLVTELKAKFNLIFIFHATREKEKDAIYYELVCEGAAKVFTWQPADLAAYMFIDPSTGMRRLGFTPQADYSAKAGHGIKGIVNVPELDPGQPNVFLTDLFNAIRKNIAAEDDASGNARQQYAEIMTVGREAIDRINLISDIPQAVADVKMLGEALTSKAELNAYFKARLEKVGITFNRETKKYEQTPAVETGAEGDMGV